jgi:two-component system chemotaxis sensor kinase CheA
VDLGLTLGYRSASTDISARSLLLVESSAGRRAALVVDRIVGQREVVIKGLSENYGHVPGIAAATILGDGSIALIVDVDQVAARGPGLRDTESLLSAVGAR